MIGGRIAEPIAIHLIGEGGVPFEFSWRGRRHRVRAVLGVMADRAYRLRTASGLRCLVSQRSEYWQLDRLI